MNQPVFNDFVRFAKLHVESGDIDPTYPVLKRVYEVRDYTAEQRLWFTLLYVTWYSLESAQRVFSMQPRPGLLADSIRLPTGIERRGFRGNHLAPQTVNTIWSMVKAAFGSLENWTRSIVDGAPLPEVGWVRVRRSFEGFPWCGPWASYKWADLLKNVHDYPITANDIGVGGGSETAGPIPGMVRVTGEHWRRCAEDSSLQWNLLQASRQAGVPFSGLDQLETSLCDFNSLCKGGYYVGHDIDLQMEHFSRLTDADDWWKARRKVFDKMYLGEVGNGWKGVRKERKKFYVERGEI